MKAVEAERARARAEREAEIQEAMRVEEENWRRWEEERIRKEAEELLAAQTAAIVLLVRRMRVHVFRCQRHRAASVLQRMARHWLTRRRLRAAIARRQLERHNKRMTMATVVQRVYRGWQGRKVARTLWEERQQRRIRRATPLLQSVVRGFLSRRLTMCSLRRARSNTILLQRVVRGHLARKHFQHERARVLAEQKRRKAAEAKRAAICLQRVQRGHRGRAQAAVRREEVARALHAQRSGASARLQTWFRACRLRTKTRATMLLQRVVRGRLGRNQAHLERRRHHAAREMQRLVRGRRGRARAALEIEVQRQEEERRVQERAEAERLAAIEAAQAAEAIELELELQHQLQRGGRHVEIQDHASPRVEPEQAASAEGVYVRDAAPRVAKRVTALRRLVEANRQEGSAAKLLQRIFRGARIRKAFRRAMGGAGYVDDDDYHYGEVDVDSFLDLEGGLDGLLGDDLLEYRSADDEQGTEEEASEDGDEGGNDGHDAQRSVPSVGNRDRGKRRVGSNVGASHNNGHAGDSRALYDYSNSQQPRRPVGKHKFNILPSKHEAGAAAAIAPSDPPTHHPKQSKQEKIDSIADQWGFKDKRTAMLMLKRRRKFERGKKKQQRLKKKKSRSKVKARDHANAKATRSDPNGPSSRHGEAATSISRPPVHAWSSELMAAGDATQRPRPPSGSSINRPPSSRSLPRNARPSSRERAKLSYSSGPASSTCLPPILGARRIKSSGSVPYSSKR